MTKPISLISQEEVDTKFTSTDGICGSTIIDHEWANIAVNFDEIESGTFLKLNVEEFCYKLVHIKDFYGLCMYV